MRTVIYFWDKLSTENSNGQNTLAEVFWLLIPDGFSFILLIKNVENKTYYFSK